MRRSRSQLSARKQAKQLALVACASIGPCVLAGIALIGYAAWIAQVGSASEHWPKADAVIRSANINEEFHFGARGRTTRSYRAKIVYEYSVENQQYEGYRVSLLDSSRRNHAMDLIAQYGPGFTTHAYYDPANPVYSLLVPGIPSLIWVVVGVGAAFLIAALAIAIPVVRRYRELRSA